MLPSLLQRLVTGGQVVVVEEEEEEVEEEKEEEKEEAEEEEEGGGRQASDPPRSMFVTVTLTYLTAISSWTSRKITPADIWRNALTPR